MTDSQRHSTAVIADEAELADDVVVGPYAVIEDRVSIGSGTVIGPHAVIGDDPQLVPSILADKVAGVHVAFAIAAALFDRTRTGKGARLEIPMAETMAASSVSCARSRTKPRSIFSSLAGKRLRYSRLE